MVLVLILSLVVPGDVITGGAGVDVYDINAITESALIGINSIAAKLATGLPADIMTVAAGDKVDLAGIIGNATVALDTVPDTTLTSTALPRLNAKWLLTMQPELSPCCCRCHYSKRPSNHVGLGHRQLRHYGRLLVLLVMLLMLLATPPVLSLSINLSHKPNNNPLTGGLFFVQFNQQLCCLECNAEKCSY